MCFHEILDGSVGQTEAFRSSNLDARRKFLLELGATRMVAHALAVRSLKVPDFNLRDFQRQRFRLSVELGDSQQGVVDSEVLRSIGDYVDDFEHDLIRPRTPSPPRNIDWHQHTREESPEMNQRSRPRENREDRNSHGGQRGFAGQDREPFPRNQGPVNGSFNNQSNRRNANQTQGGEPNRRNQNTRNNPNSRQQSLQGRYSNTIGQRFVQNSNQHEFEQETRNPYNRNHNQPGNVNRNHLDEPIGGRSGHQMEFKRNNGPNNSNPNKPVQNRNPNNNQLNRRNMDPQEINRNFPEIFGSSAPHTGPVAINRNEHRNRNNFDGNQQEYNRNNRSMNMNDMRLKQGRFGNSDEFNHNDEDFNPNNQALNRQGANRNYRNQHIDYRGQQSNFRDGPSNDDNFGPDPNDYSEGVDMDPMMEEQQEDMGLGHIPQNQHLRLMGQEPIRPQIGRNYQRIVHDNQITICRTDLMDTHERSFAGEPFEEEDPRIPYGRNAHPMDNEPFHGHQRSNNFERPGFRGQDEPNEPFFNPNQSFEDHEMEETFEDDNFFGRNDRYSDEHHRHFNDDGDGERREPDNVRGGDIHRISPRKHGAVRGSNNPNIPRNQYQGDRRSGSVAGPPNRHRNDNLDGPTKPRNGSRRPSPGRNTNPGGPRSIDGHNKTTSRAYSKTSQDPKAHQRTQGRGANPNRSNSSTSLGRNSSSGAQQPSAKRNGIPIVGKD